MILPTPYFSKSKKPKRDIGFAIGGASKFDPSKLGNLTNWFEPENLAFTNPPTNNSIKWDDTVQVGESYTGTFVQKLTAPIRDITTLNGHNVLTMLSSTVTENVPYTTATKIQKDVFTFGGIVKLDSALANLAMHFMRCSGLGGCNGAIGIITDGTGKLRIFSRSDNAQGSIVDSVSTFNGNGWFVIIVQVDQTTGLCRLVESGNDIANTNALQDGVTWNVTNANTNLLNNALFTLGGWWIGAIGECFFYNDIKTDSQINQLGNYLDNKYALSNWVDI